jgi:two-component system, sensor histidine kinase LadS
VAHRACHTSRSFQPLPVDLVIGYKDGAVWLSFALTQADNVPAQWWLEVDRPSLDQVTLYSQTPDGAWRAEEQGDNRPWNDRAVRARNSVFVLNLPEGQTRTYFLRVASSGSMNLSLRLWQPAAFVEHVSITMFLMGGFAIAALVMALINLIQWLSLRERLYFTYALYILAEAGLLLALEGVYHFLVAPERPQVIEAVISLLHPLFIALMALVFRAVVRLDHHLPRIDRLYRRLAWGLIALGALSVALGFDAPLKPWLWYVLLLEMLCNLALATWLAFRGNPQARLYLLAFSAFIAGTLYAILAALGFYENRFGSNAPVMAGVLVHMILMQLTVNEHTYAAKRAHDAAREQSLRAERRATSGLNREVATRTRELRAANLQLEQEIADRTQLALDLAESRWQLEQAFALEQAATREQRAFLHMVGHEFRTPLAVIDSASQLLAIKRPADTEQGQVIARIRRGVARLSSLFDNFLATGRLDDGGMTLNPTIIQAETIADWIREQAALMSARHPFVLELDSNLTTLEVDLQLLHVLLSNLVSNAIKFSPPDTEVTLRLARQDAHCRIEVVDRGSGIPAEEQPLLFQKFRRGRAVAGIPGLGLGLSVVARIVSLHGGTITINSREGAGTCVRVELPLRSPHPSIAPILS